MPKFRRSKGHPVIAHMAVCVAWLSVALFFGWREHARKRDLAQSVRDLAETIGLSAPAHILRDLQAVLDAATRPDWTILALLALLISLRSFYSAVGVARLQKVNCAVGGLLRRL